MNTVSILTLTGIIVAANKLATGKYKELDTRYVVGFLVYMLFMAVLNQARPELASRMAILVAIGVAYVYVPELVKLLGF